jgi:hypothetical protein
MQTPRYVAISSPIAGNVTIVSVQGRVVRSMCAAKAGTLVWDTKDAAKGLYLLQLQNGTQTLHGKVFVH